MPLALSASHAEMWVKDNKVSLVHPGPIYRCRIYSPTLQVMLRDLDAPFGTFVNSVKLAGEMALNSGDIIVRRSTVEQYKCQVTFTPTV